MDERLDYPVLKLSAKGNLQIRAVATEDHLVLETTLGHWDLPIAMARMLRDWLNENVKD